MNKKEILKNIYKLSLSQGFYSRIYRTLTNGSDESEEALKYLEQQNFKDAVDIVLFLET